MQIFKMMTFEHRIKAVETVHRLSFDYEALHCQITVGILCGLATVTLVIYIDYNGAKGLS